MSESDYAATAPWSLRLWTLRRVMGLASIADGVAYLLTPWKPGLAYKTAKQIARENGRLRLDH